MFTRVYLEIETRSLTHVDEIAPELKKAGYEIELRSTPS